MKTQKQQDAVGDGRLRSRCRHLENTTKRMRRFWFCPFVLLCEIMMSSTKPEVHKVSHCRQRRVESQSQENLVKFGSAVFHRCQGTDNQTDRQAHRHADHNTAHVSADVWGCMPSDDQDISN